MEPSDIVPLGELVLSSLGDAASSPRDADEYPGSPLLVGEEVTDHEEEGLAPLVAELHGDLAGLASFQRRSMARSSHVVELLILVHPRARGQGIGALLLSRAQAQVFCVQGVDKLVMIAARDDGALLRLLECASGWHREQRTPMAFARRDARVDVESWAIFNRSTPRQV